MTKAFSLLEHILIALRRPRVGDPKEPTQWPSEGSCTYEDEHGLQVAGSCRRRSFFRLLVEEYTFDPSGVPENLHEVVEILENNKKPTEDYMRFIWAQGELYEQYIIDMAKQTGVFLYTQVPIYIPGYTVSGKLDLIFVDPETGKLHIAEAKSVYGEGGTKVMGTPAMRREGYLGTPKDSNLIQAGIYEWWWASKNEAYGHTRLIYGDRGTGMYAEFEVACRPGVDADGNPVTEIWYLPMCRKGEWTKSPFTIDSILAAYRSNRLHIQNGTVPDRDFDEVYSKEKLALYYNTGRLTRKADREQWEAHVQREELNAQLEAEGKKPKVPIKIPEVGDFHCRYCDFSKACPLVGKRS